MRYRLRTLLILVAVLPPLSWGAFAVWLRIEAWRESQRIRPGMAINVPAMGTTPLAFDFAFPVAPQGSADAMPPVFQSGTEDSN